MEENLLILNDYPDKSIFKAFKTICRERNKDVKIYVHYLSQKEMNKVADDKKILLDKNNSEYLLGECVFPCNSNGIIKDGRIGIHIVDGLNSDIYGKILCHELAHAIRGWIKECDGHDEKWNSVYEELMERSKVIYKEEQNKLMDILDGERTVDISKNLYYITVLDKSRL